jgi:hypothetical protein
MMAGGLFAVGGWSASAVSAAPCGRGFKPFIQGAPSESLLSLLGVLRRPATPADALPPKMKQLLGLIDESRGVEVFVNYIRNVDGFYVVPERLADCGRFPGAGSLAGLEQIALSDGSGGGGAGTAEGIETGAAVEGLVMGSFGSSSVIGLVPDGVVAVMLHYPAGKVGGFDRQRGPAFNVTVKIVGNLFVATIPRGALPISPVSVSNHPVVICARCWSNPITIVIRGLPKLHGLNTCANYPRLS